MFVNKCVLHSHTGSLQSANLLTPENAVIGQSSVLTCELHTSLPITLNTVLSVQWMHRGSLVTGSGGFVRQGSGAGASVYVTNLTLSGTTVEHSGLYSCNVSTDRQQLTAEANLTVACECSKLHQLHVYKIRNLCFIFVQFLILMFTLDHPMDSPPNLYWVPVLD